MTFYDPLVSWLSPILHPLVSWNPIFAVLLVAFFLALLSKIIYWKMTDQHVMKALKEDMKKMQEKMKLHKKEPEKMLEIQGKMMEKNMQYMMQSFKPLLVTSIPMLIILGWFNLHLAYDPIQPNTPFMTEAYTSQAALVELAVIQNNTTITNQTSSVIEGKAQFNLSLPAGTYDLKYTAPTGEATQKVLVTDKQEYLAPLVVPNSKTFSQLKINNHDRTVLDLGFLQLNWFWAYVIFSIIFSISIHRIMKLS